MTYGRVSPSSVRHPRHAGVGGSHRGNWGRRTPDKSGALKHFIEQTTWLVLALEGLFWPAAGTIARRASPQVPPSGLQPNVRHSRADRLCSGRFNRRRVPLTLVQTCENGAVMERAAGSPEDAAVREALERILRSPQFARSPRASRFLRFVVDAGLSGRGSELKKPCWDSRSSIAGPPSIPGSTPLFESKR